MSLTIREEKILEAAIAGEQSPIEPVTRREAIFAKATGADVELPPARNKEEDILSKLAVGYAGGGGGDSDFSTAEVTLIVNAGTGGVLLSGGIGGGSEGFGFLTANDAIKTTAGAGAGTTVTHFAILVKGEAVYEPSLGTIISTTGGIIYDSDADILIVTGDGTITADPILQ